MPHRLSGSPHPHGEGKEAHHDPKDEGGEPVTRLRIQQMVGEYPNLAEMMIAAMRDDDSIVGLGCDDQAEFEFGLDLILDGLERVRGEPDTKYAGD